MTQAQLLADQIHTLDTLGGGKQIEFWMDLQGLLWRVPQILGRLKPGKCPGHAALREYVIARDGGKCKTCGTTKDLIADHILSRRNGGSHHPKNLQCLCQPCNTRKASLVDKKG